MMEMDKLNSVDRECLEILTNRFYSNAGYTLGKGNGYEQTILRPRLEELEVKVKDTYPEYYPQFAMMKSAYLEKINQMYSEEKKSANKEEAAQLNA